MLQREITISRRSTGCPSTSYQRQTELTLLKYGNKWQINVPVMLILIFFVSSVSKMPFEQQWRTSQTRQTLWTKWCENSRWELNRAPISNSVCSTDCFAVLLKEHGVGEEWGMWRHSRRHERRRKLERTPLSRLATHSCRFHRSPRFPLTPAALQTAHANEASRRDLSVQCDIISRAVRFAMDCSIYSRYCLVYVKFKS